MSSGPDVPFLKTAAVPTHGLAKHVGHTRSLYTSQKTGYLTVDCEQCGLSFRRRASAMKASAHHFCSQGCAWTFRRKPVKDDCSLCGRPLWVAPSVKGRACCSVECKTLKNKEIKEQIEQSSLDGAVYRQVALTIQAASQPAAARLSATAELWDRIDERRRLAVGAERVFHYASLKWGHGAAMVGQQCDLGYGVAGKAATGGGSSVPQDGSKLRPPPAGMGQLRQNDLALMRLGHQVATCANCGLMFWRHCSLLAMRDKPCCSKACAGFLRRRPALASCGVCGRQFVTNHSGAGHDINCSKECSALRRILRGHEQKMERYLIIKNVRLSGGSWLAAAKAIGITTAQGARENYAAGQRYELALAKQEQLRREAAGSEPTVRSGASTPEQLSELRSKGVHIVDLMDRNAAEQREDAQAK